MSGLLERGLSDIVFGSIIQNTIYAVVVADMKCNIVYLNPATELLFGYSEAELLGKNDIFPMHNLCREAEAAFEEFEKTGKGNANDSFFQTTALHKNGRLINIQFNISTIKIAEKSFIFSLIQDISHVVDMRNRNDLLESLAATDELTKILNRRAFFGQAKSAFSLAMRHKEPFSLIMIDIDHFKNINDKYGHTAGDAALEVFAEIVSGIIRSGDIFGRIGGEEFCIAMVKTGQEVASSTAERIRERIASSKIFYEDSSFSITISLGVSVVKNQGDKLRDIVKRADHALYAAKNTRNKVVLSSSS